MIRTLAYIAITLVCGGAPITNQECMLERNWLIERAPSRNGPWRHAKAVKCDVFSAIRTALELRTGEGWLRLVPEGRVQNATLVNGSDD